MSVNIEKVRPGKKVVFAHPGAGPTSQQEIASECLDVGATYTVTHVSVMDWGTDLFLEGGEVGFTSVLFDDA